MARLALLQAVTLLWETGSLSGSAADSWAASGSIARALATLGAGQLPSPISRVAVFCLALVWVSALLLVSARVAQDPGTRVARALTPVRASGFCSVNRQFSFKAILMSAQATRSVQCHSWATGTLQHSVRVVAPNQ